MTTSDCNPVCDDVDSWAQRQVFLRGRPMIMHQYVELPNLYDAADEGDLNDDDGTAPLSSASHAASPPDRASAASAATSEAETVPEPAAEDGADPVPEDEASALDADTRTRRDVGMASEASTQGMAGARRRLALRNSTPPLIAELQAVAVAGLLIVQEPELRHCGCALVMCSILVVSCPMGRNLAGQTWLLMESMVSGCLQHDIATWPTWSSAYCLQNDEGRSTKARSGSAN